MIDWLWLIVPALAFAPSPPKAPPPPPPPPAKTDAEILAEKAKAAALIRQRQGRVSTILAGERPQLQPTQNAPGVGGSPTLG